MVMKLRSAGPAESKGLKKKKSKRRVSVKTTASFPKAVLPINLSRTSYNQLCLALKERNGTKNLSKDKMLSILPPCPKSVKETTLTIIKWTCRHSAKMSTRLNVSEFKGGYNLRSCCANNASSSNCDPGRPTITTVSTRSKTNAEKNTDAGPAGRRRCLAVLGSRNSTKANPPLTKQGSDLDTSVSVPMQSSLNFRCLVDKDVSSYKRLQNSHQFDYIFMNKEAPKLLLTRLRRSDTSSWFEHSPGVLVCPAIRVDITQPVLTHASQITICPKTVLPFVLNSDKCGILTILVLFGEIRVKSNSYDMNSDGEYFCKSVICSLGTQITVPIGSVYSLENWSADEVLLRYNYFKELPRY